jgi:putative CocE/NonD family hydrolase
MVETTQPVPVDLVWGLKIPMRDSVKLNATLYKPQPLTEALPVILTMTPYIADSYHERGMYFARNGYIFAAVDARGRGNSEGSFVPLEHDALDGYDCIEWLAQRPWCSGQVAMWGGSYGGYNQWAALKEFPPHLAAIVPVAAAHPAVDMPFFKNIFNPYEMQWLTLVSANTPNTNLFGESSFWIQKFTKLYQEHLPFNELDRLVGNPSASFQNNLAHPTLDTYWESLAPTPQDYSKYNLPILTITGHYDGDQPGAMAFYLRHMQYGSKRGIQNHYLIVGPWDHAGTRTPKSEFGGLKFGEASLLDMNRLHKEWYDWAMKNGERPEFLQQRVAYYVMGAEEWKYADSLEEIAGERLRLYLDSDHGQANDVFNSGILLPEAPSRSEYDRYTYDPLDTKPAALEQERVEEYLLIQRDALNLFGNGVVYHSLPFEEEAEISGFVKFAVWIAIDVADTDFIVTLYEVLRDGSSIQLTQDMLRARYRQSLREEKLVVPGEINPYIFDWFTFFSRRITRGSRLRLVLACPNSIHAQKNYNSGGDVSLETAKDAHTAQVTLYHDAVHPSYLEIPVVK